MILYYHPLSSYCWKAMIALYESGIPFERRMLGDEGVAIEWLDLWPIGKFPVLFDPARDTTIGEAASSSNILRIMSLALFVRSRPIRTQRSWCE